MSKLIIVILLTAQFFSCQEKSFDYKILQYEGTDSLNTIIVKEVKFNADSLVTYEKYSGYKSDYANSTADVNITMIYNDKLLIKTLKYYPKKSERVYGDSSKIKFYYNDKNLLERRVSYDHKRLIKSGLSLNDNLSSENFEKEYQWQLNSETFFSYDSLGRKIEYNAPEKHWSNQNRFVWSYDNRNRILEEQSFNKNQLIWTKKYEYNNNAYTYILTWYDYEGNPTHLKDKSWEYISQNTYEFKLNKDGLEIEELVMNEKGEFIREKTTEYNDKNQILKTIMYLEPKVPSITHIYIYE